MTSSEHIHDATLVFVCSHVVDDGLPVLQVTRDFDGDWQFLCGGDDHLTADKARIACWTCMMEQDPMLTIAGELQLGHTLVRQTVDHSWFAAPTPAEVEQ